MPDIAGTTGRRKLSELAEQRRAQRASSGLPDWREEERKRRLRAGKASEKAYNRKRPALHSFYRSPEWRRLRRAYRALHPYCEHCIREGRMVAAEIVDHIIELKDGGAPLDPHNLMSLCRGCHNRKTAQARRLREQGGGGGKKSEPPLS